MRARLLRASWPTVAVLAVLGVIAAGVGVGLRTIWLPSSSYVATATIPPNTPAVVTAPGVLEMMPGPVQVTAKGSPDATLLIARGREADVQAWVQGSQVATITGLAAPNTLSVATEKANQVLPDPATSDLWVDSVTGKEVANYTYRQTAGRYLLLLGTVGGPGAPATVTLTWPQAIVTPWSWPLIGIGSVLLLAALVVAIVVFGRARRKAAEEVSITLRPKVSLVREGREDAESAATVEMTPSPVDETVEMRKPDEGEPS